MDKSLSRKERSAAYYTKNKERNRESANSKVAAYRAANVEKLKAYRIARRAVHGDKLRASANAWVANNPERKKESDIAWRTANPEKVSAYKSRYRASKLKATPIWANTTKIEEFYYTANMLGMHTGDWYHVDHIVPLQSKRVCGLHCEHNLQVLLGVDNICKNNRLWPDMPSVA